MIKEEYLSDKPLDIFFEKTSIEIQLLKIQRENVRSFIFQSSVLKNHFYNLYLQGIVWTCLNWQA